MDKVEIKKVLLNPKDNHYDFCKITLYDLLLDSNADFARMLRRRWEHIYDNSTFYLRKDEENNKIVQLIDANDRDITIMVNVSKSGNLNITVSSLYGYCCHLRIKNLNVHIDM